MPREEAKNSNASGFGAAGRDDHRQDHEAGEPSTSAASLPVYETVARYEKLHRIGEGTYGVVYKARDVTTGEIVALKKVRFERSRDGVPVTAIRELRVLQQCRHANIVQLKRVVTGSKPDSVFLVFEYCQHDLGRLLDALPRPFSEAEVKGLLLQLLHAVSFLHERWVLHRDLKLSNLLYTSEGVLKLCDFGLARYFQPHESVMTPRVVTLWYRAPELLLGSDCYSEAIDMWAVGCILGELLRHEPLFPAQQETECLQMMSRLLGTPSARIWPGLLLLPHGPKLLLPDQPYNYLRRQFPALSDAGIQLLNGLLTYDPSKRLTAQQALDHPYFQEKPYPKRPHDMPTFPSSHEPAPPSSSRRGVAAPPGAAKRSHPQEDEDIDPGRLQLALSARQDPFRRFRPTFQGRRDAPKRGRFGRRGF